MSNLQQNNFQNIAIQDKIPANTAITSLQLAIAIASAADDKKAGDIVLLKVAEVSYLTDYFVVVTGFSTPQVRAICDSIDSKITERFQQEPIRVEGKTDGRWVLVDYGDVIAHIFLPEEREYYNLEAFWGHAERIEYTDLQKIG